MALTKIDDRGLNTPIDLLDNEKIRFGTGNDLSIFHDGTNNFIETGGADIIIYGTGEDLAKFNDNGVCELYFDNSKKLSTASTGVTVSGDLTVTSTSPGIWFTDTNSDPDWRILNLDGTLGVYDVAASRYALQFEGDADVLIPTDTGKLKFGASQDLEIFHNGSHSFIKDVGTGNLAICGSLVAVHAADATENMILCSQNGSIQLYYDNSKKLETKSWGVELPSGSSLIAQGTGYLKVQDNGKFYAGNDEDLQIYHDGSNTYLDNHTGTLSLRGDGERIFIKPVDGEESIIAKPNNNVELYFDNAKKFETTSTGATFTGTSLIKFVGDDVRYIDFEGNGNNRTVTFRSIASGIEDHFAKFTANGGVHLYYDNAVKINTNAAGVTVSGNVDISNGHLEVRDAYKARFGNSQDLQIYHDASGGHNHIHGATNCPIIFKTNDSERCRITSGGDLNFENDSSKITLGTGQDLQLYHDGSNSRIYNTTGNLSFRSGSYYFNNAAGTENCLDIVQNGAVSLYYDNSKKFQTTSGGAEILGHLLMNDSNEIQLGSSGDLKLYHDGSNSFVTNGTGILRVRSSEIRLCNTDNETYFQGVANGAAKLYHNDSVKLATESFGLTVTGRCGRQEHFISIFTSSGTFTPHANANSFEVWATGGGGSGGNANHQNNKGSGGGGGGTAIRSYSIAQMGANASVTIGSGGTGVGNGNNGGNGGGTTFNPAGTGTTIVGGGGSGGNAGNETGGAGGTCSGHIIPFDGGRGGRAMHNTGADGGYTAQGHYGQGGIGVRSGTSGAGNNGVCVIYQYT